MSILQSSFWSFWCTPVRSTGIVKDKELTNHEFQHISKLRFLLFPFRGSRRAKQQVDLSLDIPDLVTFTIKGPLTFNLSIGDCPLKRVYMKQWSERKWIPKQKTNQNRGCILKRTECSCRMLLFDLDFKCWMLMLNWFPSSRLSSVPERWTSRTGVGRGWGRVQSLNSEL